ncbi:hypothetical protein OAG99_01770 [Akkermansiaceae bacterium]|nr:hypothetical protein [Akkermansiaceae bacterium]
MSFFQPPPATHWNVLSLGAGVQSSTLALMAAQGEILPAPDFALFADTGAEPLEVYQWLETLKNLINQSPHPFPVYTVKEGDLEEATTKVRISQGKGKKPKGESYLKRIIPMFGRQPDGSMTAALGRSCTADYKIKPIHKFIKKHCGIKRGQKEITVTEWIGISWDEIQRAKISRVAYMQKRYPLLEQKITRSTCLHWIEKNRFPTPPRSACYFCPFHSDLEWRSLRDKDPEHFSKAISYDTRLREAFAKNDKFTDMTMYLHRSCRPLKEIDFDNDEDKGQQTWDFQAECEGMCGV